MNTPSSPSAAPRQPVLGVVGLGNMGQPMSARLAGAGFALVVHDLDAARVRGVVERSGARAATSLAELGTACDVVITLLPDGAIVRRVLLGERGDASGDCVAAGLRDGAVVIDMSSSSPVGTRALAPQLAARGVRMLDAPVSGGVRRAADGTLAIMVGGDADLLAAMGPVLAPMGRTIHAGGTGAGHAVKALNNYVSAAGLLAACEAVRAGERFGLDPATVVDVINASTGVNNSTQNKLKPFVLSGSYADGFGLALMAKDLRTALEVAHAGGSPTALAATVVEVWNDAEERLGARADPTVNHTAIDRYLGLLGDETR